MKIGFLGAGNIATTMATTLQSVKGAECYAVASRDKNKAQEFADKFGFEKAYGSYADMLSDPQVKLVYISTPHSHHYEHIKMCLEHDKHVICEKAFTVNAAQASEVFGIAENRGLFITEAIWTRYMPMRGTINKVIRSGIIGKPTMLSANLGYPLEHVDRLVKPELAGGALLDLGVYVLNFASMVFGDDITGIVADCTKYESGVDAQETIILTYSDGKMASLFSTMLAQTDRRGFIYGTNGYIEIENINNYESIRVYNLERKVVAEYAAPVQITGYEYEMTAAMQAIRDGALECREMPHYQSIRMMQLMDSLRDAWGIKYPFEKESEGRTVTESDDRKGTKGEGSARMITEQHIQEGISKKVSVAPDVETETIMPDEDEIRSMIHVINTPPIDRRGEAKKQKEPSGTPESSVKIISRQAPKIKSRASGLRAGSLDEMREKLENERKDIGGSELSDDKGGFIGDLVLEGAGKPAGEHSSDIVAPVVKPQEGRNPGGEKKKPVVRIVDEAVSDYVDIAPSGQVTINAVPRAEIRVNEDLVRRLSPLSTPLEDEGIVSEVIHSGTGEAGPAKKASPGEQQYAADPDKREGNSVKEEPRKKNVLGRLFTSVFRNDTSDYNDDYIDE
ncbi:MAG: Gfo/Idh/MocA family oxidoreductase [Lachnospiraceae bacterium]|nr:Gfo/Idh/MocA family oxidoreductase [Lachnospiraceae bacterium]